MNRGRRPGAPAAAMLAAMAFVALTLALFPLYPRRVEISPGDTASRTIRAPRAFSYISERLTEQQRQQAAEAVPDVLNYDANVRPAQLERFDNAIAAIERVRARDASPAEKAATLRSVPDLAGLSEEAALRAVELDDERWKIVVSEARNALDETLAGPLDAATVDTARKTLQGRLSADIAPEEATLAAELIQPLIVPTMEVDQAATDAAREAARQAVVPVRVSYAAGQTIVEANQTLTEDIIEALEEAGYLSRRFEFDTLLGAMVAAGLAAGSIGLYASVFQPKAVRGPRQMLVIAVALAIPVFFAKTYFSLILPDQDRHFLAYVLPVAAGPMLVAALLETGVGVVVAGLAGALVALSAVFLPEASLVESVGALDALRLLLVYGFSSLVGVFAIDRAERLQRYLGASFAIAAVAFVALLATWFVDSDRQTNDLAWMAAAAGVNGMSAGFLAAGAFVTVGLLFGITTRVQLLELSQLNSPLLRRLQAEAPGTFHHSVVVGNMAERAADLVGADSLLTRVGCYYHDIGKILQPGFYIENQLGGDNPHEGLTPEESARKIKEHVANGLELARKYRLPDRVRQFIPEHHGTRLVAYFYRKAAEGGIEPEDTEFRYDGPKPQSRETAIVMLADSCEAYVRANPDHSAEAIDAIVERVIAERVAEGQLDECDLTFRDLRTIAESFKTTLRAVYHPRIEYPEPTPSERRLVSRLFPTASARSEGRGRARPVSH